MTGIAQIAELQFPSLERIFFNAAGWHPLPRVAIEALTRYAASRGHPDHGQDNTAFILNSVRTNVARLIGASASDIALVPSTTVAEQLFVRAAGLPSSGALVTDLMHFDASIYAYDAMARAGADVRLVEPSRWPDRPGRHRSAACAWRGEAGGGVGRIQHDRLCA